ncbi:putative bifunctional diguanylate cyclase/phosphodiesterase [Gellertiella hungarica]|uniref:Diguanylate cyclase (GGDEF)-like protein/PAS domain S-box-containing protein n=1 Tax=Gellertiella hungarica TaxID=1572859 RepID=A0A7W6J856_9HYPH|nr:GGDEF domain-containing phosphodiesterase [Gellertiella hungarica]MBB4066581.1 diguanylate cyclase (GGDEF)-like protein/PAS domain S-box-containing protein [Gellertiella hungarica]
MSVRRFAEATDLSLIVINGEGDIEFVNQSACDLFGHTREEMIGQPITIIIPERMRGAHMAGLARVASGEKPSLGGKAVEVFAVKKDGSEFPIEITLSVWRGPAGFAAGAVIKDITERRERDAKLMRLASQDALTGLHNRHQFTNLVGESLAAGPSATVMLFDLDGFKEVNDTYGHSVGDTLLQAVAVRLSHISGPDWALARFGGDEFAFLVPAVGDPTHWQKEGERVIEAFRKPFHLGGLVLDLSASVGVATGPQDGAEAEELIASADFALYRAKAAGGYYCRLFDPGMRDEAQARRTMRDELRQALRNGELELHYQPQVQLATGRIYGFEALIRWNDPQRGLLPPGLFLPALEQSALALDIGWWTLDEACRVIARLNAGGSDLRMSVNLFPIQFRALNLCDKVSEALRKHGVPPEHLELEITEEVALGDERSLHTLTELRDMGVGVAFDDFGTGYASLLSLQRYPLTTLKIDRGFIRDLDNSPQDAAITRALIGMSHDLGLQTIAEGIETEAQEAALIAMGCPFGQGFRYGRAVPESELDALLRLPVLRETA